MFGAPLTLETFYNEHETEVVADEVEEVVADEVEEVEETACEKLERECGEETVAAEEAAEEEAEEETVESFNNQVTFGRNFLTLDATLRALLFACLFFVLTHSDTQGLLNKLAKMLPKSLKPYVPMLVFAVLYYVVNMFV